MFSFPTRLGWIAVLVLSPVLVAAAIGLSTGALDLGGGRVEAVWGRRGFAPGEFNKPRAIAIDQSDRLYIVDKAGRIQVFDAEGRFLRGWETPLHENGKPSGLSIGRDGNLLVADTHYFRMLVYTPQGKLLDDRTLGGQFGHQPGEFGLVTDVVQDSHGNYYIAEYGQYDRIQKFSPQGEFLFQWGGHGAQPGQFARPQNLAIDEHDHIWVADACNHRIQVFDATKDEARRVRMWGRSGREPGRLYYPYDLVLDGKGHVIVCEYGNNRIQRFTLDGKSLGCWGTAGGGEGRLHQPWGLVRDSNGRIHIVDTYNHRVQRVKL